MKLNENIAALRKKKGLTQEELAQVFGVTNQAVSKWESSQSCPDVALLPEIAAFFGVSVDALMGAEPSLARIVSAVEDYVAPEGGDYLPDKKMWEASVAAFVGWCCTGQDREERERFLKAKPVKGTACWSYGSDGGGLFYPPGMFIFQTSEGLAEGRDYDNALNFCRCFAKEDNWRILRALTWDIPKSAVELAVETGLEAAAVEKALAEDFGNVVHSKYILGQTRWSVFGWVKPLLCILGYY
jgi:transcriptional regulator with XRE-family HTH domain